MAPFFRRLKRLLTRVLTREFVALFSVAQIFGKLFFDLIRLLMSKRQQVTVISRSMARRLRMKTLLAGLSSMVGSSRRIPRRIIFIHIPKTGGMTVQQYLTHCLGGKQGARRCKLNEIYLNWSPSDRKIEKARKSRFVCGHFSWASIERFGRSEGDYIFTFLREPRSRLRSFYRVMTNYPEDHLTKDVQERVERCQNMSQCDMFTTADLDLRNMIDNYMVRQLSGHLTDYPIRESDWPDLFETARRNLESMNYVGFLETYEADFAQILRELNLPHLVPIPRENATEVAVKRAVFKSKAHCENPADVRAAMAPLVRWDEMLYEHALALREARAA